MKAHQCKVEDTSSGGKVVGCELCPEWHEHIGPGEDPEVCFRWHVDHKNQRVAAFRTALGMGD